MKRVKTMILIGIAFLACFLIPWRTTKVGGYPDNLWTSSGQWRKPAEHNRLFYGIRRQHGLMLPWLVYDRATDQDAWYIRIDYRVLVVFAGSAFLASIILSLFLPARS